MPTVFYRDRRFDWRARFALPTLRTAFFFLLTDLRGGAFPTAAFFALRSFGRFFTAARCAAPSAALAHSLNSSVSSNSRAGSYQ